MPAPLQYVHCSMLSLMTSGDLVRQSTRRLRTASAATRQRCQNGTARGVHGLAQLKWSGLDECRSGSRSSSPIRSSSSCQQVVMPYSDEVVPYHDQYGVLAHISALLRAPIRACANEDTSLEMKSRHSVKVANTVGNNVSKWTAIASRSRQFDSYDWSCYMLSSFRYELTEDGKRSWW